MADKVTLKDVISLVELNKARAEQSFRLNTLTDAKPEEAEAMKSRLAELQNKIERISQTIKKTGAIIAMPNEKEIARLNDSLSSCTAQDMLDAMKKKSGDTYSIMVARGALMKKNFENRENIAKLALLTAGLQKDVKEAIAEAVRAGSFDSPIPLLDSDEKAGNKIAALLGRLGIMAECTGGALVKATNGLELAIKLNNRTVWVTPELHDKLNANLAKIREISPKIQLKNAVRQIKQFDDEEEKEFAAIQGEYLQLLKEQDDLLKDFLDEEKIEIRL